MVTMREESTLLEDLTFLDETRVGATEAARRTDFPTAEALEKWLSRHGHTDLWNRLKNRDPAGTHTPEGRRRQREKTTGKRVCSNCDVEQPLTNFYEQEAGRDGRMARCMTCTNKRPPTESRMVRNRARNRAYALLAKRHAMEFAELLDAELESARAEHAVITAAAAGQPDAPVARLRPGQRRRGEDITDRLDVARCQTCHTHHDANHECPSCGDTTPATAPTNKPWQIRAWALEHGIEVPSRGPIPDRVLRAYTARQGGAA